MGGLVFKRSQQAMFADVGDEIIAMQVERGHCFGMEDVAASVWQLLAEPRSLAQLCQSLMAEFEVDEATCREQVAELLAEMVGEGLVEQSTE